MSASTYTDDLVPELSQPHGENPKFREDSPLVSVMIVTQMKNRFFFFLVFHLQNDVLRSAGSAIKVSRGAWSRTFDVPDLRSGCQAYVLAAPREKQL